MHRKTPHRCLKEKGALWTPVGSTCSSELGQLVPWPYLHGSVIFRETRSLLLLSPWHSLVEGNHAGWQQPGVTNPQESVVWKINVLHFSGNSYDRSTLGGKCISVTLI